jgi:hypothetical protein
LHDFVKEERHMPTKKKSAKKKSVKKNPVSISTDGEVVTPEPEDEESKLDGCSVAIKDTTPDEDLPPAEGGVA